MKRYNIALTQALSEEGMEYLRRFAEPHVINSSDEQVLLSALPGMDGLISRGGPLTRDFFRKASQLGLKVLGKTSAGIDSVDLDSATEFGVPVVFTPGANARSVAEYTIAAMLAVNKQIPWSDREMHKLHRDYRNRYAAQQFEHKTVLLLGFGHIGQLVAQMCRGLSMEVIVYDKYASPAMIEHAGYTRAEDLRAALPNADFISVHMPLTQETYGMLGAEELALMKSSAIVINTARGGIVDEAALVKRLNAGLLGGAFFDVVEGEPDIQNSPLVGCEQVVLSGHIAGQTNEAMLATAQACVDGVIAVLEGKQWPKTANPRVYEQRHNAGRSS